MYEFFVPVILFTLIVLILSSFILLVRGYIIGQRSIMITVNSQSPFAALSGDSLLVTLASADIYLPAACGGRAGCGQCKVVVNHGGGAMLATEMPLISQEEAHAGYRLACMLKVRSDLNLTLPPELLKATQLKCQVVSNCRLSTYLTELTLSIPPSSQMVFRAGDYVLVEAPAGTINFASLGLDRATSEQWEDLNLLHHSVKIAAPTTRAYSITNAPDTGHTLVLVVRIALPPPNVSSDTPPGMVSSYIFNLVPGDSVRVSGPFGNFHAQDNAREKILIGGGAGIAPLHSIIVDQLRNQGSQCKISFWYGCRNLQELVYFDDFNILAQEYENFSYHAALSEPNQSDNWDGYVGLIHNVVFEQYLKRHAGPENADYYLCGPPLMSGAVLTMLEDLGVERRNIFLDDFGSGKPL